MMSRHLRGHIGRQRRPWHRRVALGQGATRTPARNDFFQVDKLQQKNVEEKG